MLRNGIQIAGGGVNGETLNGTQSASTSVGSGGCGRAGRWICNGYHPMLFLHMEDLVYRVPVSTGKLAGMSLPPPSFEWTRLCAVGVTHVVSLSPFDQGQNRDPVRQLYQCLLENIADSEVPSDPEHDSVELWRAAYHVYTALRVGRGVAVHCDDGRGRTGVVLAATLRLRGLPVDRSIELINDSLRDVAAPVLRGAAWHVQQLFHPPESFLLPRT